MKLTLLHKILSISVLAKAIPFKKGVLLLLSAPLSLGFTHFIKSTLKGVSAQDLALPILTIVFSFLLYIVFFTCDFVWGLIASKHESTTQIDWVKSNKLYSSLGKLGGVLLIDFLLLSIIIFLIVIGFVTISTGILVIAVMLNVVAMMYEFHSIGENIKRKTGQKSKYFLLFDRITIALENKIINKIETKI